MTEEPVILINAFEVPTEADTTFLDTWQKACDLLSTQDGYLSAHLHRSLTPDADFRFVNIGRWASPHAFRAATATSEFHEVSRMPYPFHAALYTVVRQDTALRS